MSIIYKDNLKCIIMPQHTFPLSVNPSQMRSGPEKSKAFLDVGTFLLICSDLTQKWVFLPNVWACARGKSASWCCLLVCFVCIGCFILKNSWILCAVSMSDFLPAWSSLCCLTWVVDQLCILHQATRMRHCPFWLSWLSAVSCFPVVSLSLCFMSVPSPSFPLSSSCVCVCVPLLGVTSWFSSHAVCTWGPAADHLIYSSDFPDCCLLYGTRTMTYFLVY